MARTDHLTWGEYIGENYCGDSPWHYVERPRHFKVYKKLEHKRNRKRKIPHTNFRGYGYGDGNFRYMIEMA